MTTSRRLALLAGQAVDGVGLGRHGKRRAGRTQSFREHRPYVTGDDLRHVDWHVLARRDQIAVKVFEDEAPIRVELVVDVSGSMGTHNKLEQAQVLALAVAQVALSAGEEVGLLVLGQGREPLRRQVLPAAGLGHLSAIGAALSILTCAGPTPMAEGLTALGHRLRRRSQIICCSDFWCNVSGLGGIVHKLIARRHDVTLVHVWHPLENDLPDVGQVLWQGQEDDGAVVGDANVMRSGFRADVTEHRSILSAGCHQAGGVYVSADATAAHGQMLRAVLTAQKQRRRSGH